MNREEIEELKILTFRSLNNYEKLEVERLKNKINEIIKAINILNKNKAQNAKQPTVFIDTQGMEERYAEQLYQDYLVEQNKDLQQRIDKAIEYMNSEEFFMKMNSNSIQPPADKYVCQDYFEAKEKLVEILGGKECQ